MSTAKPDYIYIYIYIVKEINPGLIICIYSFYFRWICLKINKCSTRKSFPLFPKFNYIRKLDLRAMVYIYFSARNRIFFSFFLMVQDHINELFVSVGFLEKFIYIIIHAMYNRKNLQRINLSKEKLVSNKSLKGHEPFL